MKNDSLKGQHRINEQIRAKEVRIVGDDGITVDTHVKRLSNLIGLTKNDDPIKIERDLMKIVPRDSWIDFSHYLILQGRDKCIARRPKCQECEISGYCTYGKKKLINS